MPKPRAGNGTLDLNAVRSIRRALPRLYRWFENTARDFPWRRTSDPYAVLVSELMLQQTQVATVLAGRYFERWMEAFPDPAALAAAPESDVLKAWEGLGYYRRARHLQSAARAVVDRHGGQFPRELPGIMALPGVGAYTAGAVASFAFDVPAPAVDANIARVLSRLFDIRENIDSAQGRREVQAAADAILPHRGGRLHTSALMELGQTVCRIGRPDCGSCPVRTACRADSPAGLPVRSRRPAITAVSEHALWAVRDGRILLRRESSSRRTGLWRLPLCSEIETRGLGVAAEIKYSITRFRVALTVWHAPPGTATAEGESWTPLAEAGRLAMASPDRRVFERLAETAEPKTSPLGQPRPPRWSVPSRRADG